VDQGFILRSIAGGLVVDLQDALERFSLRSDEKYACTCPFEVEGVVEVHYPVFRLLLRRGHLDLCPFRHEVGEDLRLDRLLGAKLDFELSKLD
jgi:hypothetical protein